MKFEEYFDFFLEFEKRYLIRTEDVLRDNSVVTKDDFLKHIYQDFSFEEEKRMQDTFEGNNVLCLLDGLVGIGKTTLVIKNLLNLLSKKSNIGYLHFDFTDIKSELDKFKIYNRKYTDEDILQFIYTVIKRSLQEKFLRDPNRERLFTLRTLNSYAYNEILLGYINDWKSFYPNQKIGDNIEQNIEEMERVFRKNYHKVFKDEKVINFKNKLLVHQVITSITTSREFSKFILILDNIDQLEEHQFFEVCLRAAVNIHKSGKSCFTTIVAIRDRNLLRHYLGSNLEFLKTINLSERIKLEEQKTDFYKNVLNKKVVFIFDIEKYPKIKTKVLKNVKKVMIIISKRLNQDFIRERFYRLSNDNLREVHKLNLNFFYYLLHLVCNETIKIKNNELDLSTADFRSYLYRILYSKGKYTPIPFLINPIKKFIDYSKKIIKQPIECDLDLLILTWLKNNYDVIVINRMLNEFEIIGIKKKLVIKTLYLLYSRNDASHRYVDVGDSEKIIGIKKFEEEDLVIKLTPLGKEFASSTITKFEFLYQCLQDEDPIDLISPMMLIPISTNINYKVESVLSCLEKIKKIHINKIKYVQESIKRNLPNTEWEQYYRIKFCEDKLLILERIVFSHLAHLRANYENENFFNNWKSRYLKLIKDYRKEIDSYKT